MMIVPTAVLMALALAQSPSQSIPPSGDRTVSVPGLVEPEVTLRIDAEGVPWVVAETMDGLCQGEGFLHGQHRFFQMDMMRRYAAGELAALMGSAMANVDRTQRKFMLRGVAGSVLAKLPAAHLACLEAYAHGVNAGLANLQAAPPEYLLLQTTPKPWTPADSILVLLSMGDQLCSSAMQSELDREFVLQNGSRELMEFLFPDVYAEDQPMQQEGPVELPPLPSCDGVANEIGAGPAIQERLVPGSNAWVVSGDRTTHGGAILANDPHLGLTAPTTWYRVGLYAPPGSPAAWPEMDGQPSEAWWVFGLSLPGLPGVAIGTNGYVAWGFTNSEADTQDIVRIAEHPTDPNQYQVATGVDGSPVYETYTWERETIEVSRAEPKDLDIRMTRWGPVFSSMSDEFPRVRKWTLTEPGGLDMGILDVPRVRTTDEALSRLAAWAGPPQNALVADRDGHIGWTITGRFPRRDGIDGLTPVFWTGGEHWNGWLDEADRPRVMDPSSGVLYSANNRMASLETAQKLGRDWAPPTRAARIGSMLAGQDRFNEQELAAMQLDTAMPHLRPLQQRILALIDEDEMDIDIRRARAHIASWNGTAGADQVGFRILLLLDRLLTEEVLQRVLPGSMDYAIRVDQTALRRLIDQADMDCIPIRFDSWDEAHDVLFRSVVESMVAEEGDGGGLDLPWGLVNRSEIMHPFSKGTPWGGAQLDLPRHPQSGHPSAVRVAHPRFGASARLVVGPGHEQEGILQTPGGQSGHFLSSHYRDLHEAWRTGAATGLLPGEPISTVRLVQVEGP